MVCWPRVKSRNSLHDFWFRVTLCNKQTPITCSEISQPFQHLNLVVIDEVLLRDKLQPQETEAGHGCSRSKPKYRSQKAVSSQRLQPTPPKTGTHILHTSIYSRRSLSEVWSIPNPESVSTDQRLSHKCLPRVRIDTMYSMHCLISTNLLYP